MYLDELGKVLCLSSVYVLTKVRDTYLYEELAVFCIHVDYITEPMEMNSSYLSRRRERY
jgi:hypothetical protein